jgi:hypothetical protein
MPGLVIHVQERKRFILAFEVELFTRFSAFFGGYFHTTPIFRRDRQNFRDRP